MREFDDEYSARIIVKHETSGAFGVASFILGLISIFFMAPIFVPLAVLTGMVALFRKQIIWPLLGLGCAFIGAITSPILWGLLATGLLALHFSEVQLNAPTHLSGSNQHYMAPLSQAGHDPMKIPGNEPNARMNDTIQLRQESDTYQRNFMVQLQKISQTIRDEDLHIDHFMQDTFGKVEQRYRDISQKMDIILSSERQIAGIPAASFKRGQIVFDLNQGTFATQQNFDNVGSIHNQFNDHVVSLIHQGEEIKAKCQAYADSGGDTETACQIFQKDFATYREKASAMNAALKKLDGLYAVTKTHQDQIMAEATRME